MLNTCLVKLLIWVARFFDVGIEIRAMRRSGHESSMNRGRNARIAVKPSVQEFDLKSFRFRAVANSAKIAGGDGCSVHGDTSLLMNEDASEGGF